MHRQIRRRIGDRDVKIAVLGVERKRRPHGAAAHRDPFRILPRVEPGLARLRHGVEPPDRCAIGGAKCADPSLDVALAQRRPDQHEILEDDRRHHEDLAVGWLPDPPRPQLRAGLGIERQQVAVGRAAEDAAVFDRDTAVALEGHGLARLPRVAPLHTARRRVERDGARSGRDVHRPAVDDRPGLKIVAFADLEQARRREPCRGGRIDLLKRREARAAVIVCVKQPVRRLRGARQGRLIGSARRRRRGSGTRNELRRRRPRRLIRDRDVRRLQRLRRCGQRCRARGEAVHLQEVREHRRVILRGQRIRRPRRHRRARDEEDVGDRHARIAPARVERRAGERRRCAAGERRAMAGGARLAIERFPHRRLRVGVHRRTCRCTCGSLRAAQCGGTRRQRTENRNKQAKRRRPPNADTHAAQHTPAQVRRILPSRDLRPELSRARRERRQPLDLEVASRAEQIGPRRRKGGEVDLMTPPVRPAAVVVGEPVVPRQLP